MGIELDRHACRHREGLMHGAAMRNLEESLAVFGCETMRQVNRQSDVTHPMRLFRHGPFRLDAQSFGRDLMAVAVPAHEIPDATREGADKEFDRTHPSILPSILDRLIGHHSVLAAGNVVPSSTMVCDCEFHAGLFNVVLEWSCWFLGVFQVSCF